MLTQKASGFMPPSIHSPVMPISNTVRQIIPSLVATGVDAIIVSDPGLIRLIRQIAPQISLHLSTQANTTNSEAVRFWQDQGVRRIILARELSLEKSEKWPRQSPKWSWKFLSTAPCVCLIRDAAIFRPIATDEAPTRGIAPSPAAGNIS